MSSFSKRHGYAKPPEITVREDAPESIRVVALETAHKLGLRASAMRDIVCVTLRQRPGPTNWSGEDIWQEVESRFYDAEWFRVYDIIEAFNAALLELDDINDEGRLIFFEKT